MLIQDIYISLHCKIIYYKTMITADNENFIYYRNLLFRFIKEKNLEWYNEIKTKTTIESINDVLIGKIPEHYLSTVADLIKMHNMVNRTDLRDYLVYVSVNAKPLHRELAKEFAIKKLKEYKIPLDELNRKIAFERNNLFHGFEETIFSDQYNKTIYDVANNAPIGLIIFYTYRFGFGGGNTLEDKMCKLDNKWMHYIAKNIYYNENDSETW